MHELDRHAKAPRQAQNARVVATFARRTREATIGARATQEAAEVEAITAAVDTKLTLDDAEGMQE